MHCSSWNILKRILQQKKQEMDMHVQGFEKFWITHLEDKVLKSQIKPAYVSKIDIFVFSNNVNDETDHRYKRLSPMKSTSILTCILISS